MKSLENSPLTDLTHTNIIPIKYALEIKVIQVQSSTSQSSLATLKHDALVPVNV